jgi:hypothetical protein
VGLSLLLLQPGEFLSAEVAGKWITASPVSTMARVDAGWNPEHIRRLRVQIFDFVRASFGRVHRRSSRWRFAVRLRVEVGWLKRMRDIPF